MLFECLMRVSLTGIRKRRSELFKTGLQVDHAYEKNSRIPQDITFSCNISTHQKNCFIKQHDQVDQLFDHV